MMMIISYILTQSFDQAVEYFNRYLGTYNIPLEIYGLSMNGDEIEYEV